VRALLDSPYMMFLTDMINSDYLV